MKSRRRLPAVLASLVLAGGLVAVAPTPASAAEVQTRVVVNPLSQKVQRYKKYVNINGQTQGQGANGWGFLPDGDTVGDVVLQRRMAGASTWKTIQRDATPGRFSFNFQAIQNANYRVVYSGGSYGDYTFPAATSVSRWLLVRRNLNDYLSRKGGFHIRGDINPGGGLYVNIERKTCASCAYRYYKRVRSGGLGKFAVRLPVPRRGTHYFRAYVKANSKYTKSPSNKYYRVYRY